jgi:hypothetical protein
LVQENLCRRPPWVQKKTIDIDLVWPSAQGFLAWRRANDISTRSYADGFAVGTTFYFCSTHPL